MAAVRGLQDQIGDRLQVRFLLIQRQIQQRHHLLRGKHRGDQPAQRLRIEMPGHVQPLPNGVRGFCRRMILIRRGYAEGQALGRHVKLARQLHHHVGRAALDLLVQVVARRTGLQQHLTQRQTAQFTGIVDPLPKCLVVPQHVFASHTPSPYSATISIYNGVARIIREIFP